MRRALLLALLLPACVLYDGGAGVTLLPEGPLSADAGSVVLYIETGARGAAHLAVDGEEQEAERPLNEAFELETWELKPGTHEVQARVRDGAQLRESNVVELTVSAPP